MIQNKNQLLRDECQLLPSQCRGKLYIVSLKEKHEKNQFDPNHKPLFNLKLPTVNSKY